LALRREKSRLRGEIKQRLTALDPQERKREERLIHEALGGLIKDLGIQTVLAYRALADELDLDPLLARLLEEGLLLGFPKISAEAMAFYGVKSLEEDWQDGPWGLREPCTKVPLEPDSQSSLLLIPGRGFTLDGLRLGRGGGFYDRYLSLHPELQNLGVAYSLQICSQIPLDPWDRKLDAVIHPGVDPQGLRDYFNPKRGIP
jgi:5-formyltetrahydrofolate cyclo-ligase